jgi:cyanophycin synthetase
LALGENAKPGGERAMDRTETVHPWFRDLAVRAAELFQVDVAGIDLMTPKISVKPENLARTAVLEINPSPDFLAHLHPAVGSPQPVCELFLDHLFAK